ncbi:hypothetical protein GCM10018793_55180 [Streptomyces sulfonofaciens]|uniref:Uncharacterized protein n=1 Tax=Streptomyces sulfonofaciens TaxID=68272 RepID=A0A919GJT0_9ACTN|nr:hypothetical protein GCM10018793_55180 [Streptomyces sulfonofaciens]
MGPQMQVMYLRALGRHSVVPTGDDCELAGHPWPELEPLPHPLLKDQLTRETVRSQTAVLPVLFGGEHVQAAVAHSGGQLFDLAGEGGRIFAYVMRGGQESHESLRVIGLAGK